MLKKILFFLLKIPLLLLFVAAALFSVFHMSAPKYNFPPSAKFAGKALYNPYQDIDSVHWIPANYHMHSRAWGGFTNGSGTQDTFLWSLYRNLGFKSLAISNYQNINKLNNDSACYIPAYEHGYGIFKNHFLCLGARKVDWFDMPFKQTLSQKQYMIYRLHSTSELVSINHPSFFGGYAPEDFVKLTGYDFIEVLNGFRNSIPYWDSALTAGRPALLMANDDMHDIQDPTEPARRFLLINSTDNSRTSIFNALKQGKMLGVYVQIPDDESWETKRKRMYGLPVLKRYQVVQGNLHIDLSRNASEIRLIGDAGSTLEVVKEAGHMQYHIPDSISYVRAEIQFAEGDHQQRITYFTNAIMRSPDGQLPKMPQALVDTRQTWLFRLMGIAIAALLLSSFILLRKRIRSAKRA